MTARKPHADDAGYVCSLRSAPGRGYVVVYEAAAQGLDVGGMRWATVCATHSTLVGSASQRGARAAMKTPTTFCEDCRTAVATAGGAT